MNLSISSLRLSSLDASPMFTGTGQKNMFIKSSAFDRFSSSFLSKSTKFSRFDANFYETKFSRFMSSVVHVTSENHIGLKYTTTYSPDSDTSVSFQKCNFMNCQSQECGGAIFVDDYAFVLNISACVFTCCSSNKNGGAIYAEVKSSKLKRSVFTKCNTRAGCSYQSFYISLKGQFEADTVQILKNGISTESDSFSTFNIRRGSETAKQFNVTRNSVYSFGACMTSTLSRTSQLFMSYSNFVQNSCKDRELFAFYHCSDECDLGRINIVENVGGPQSPLFNAVSNSHVTVHHSVIIKNKVAAVAVISDSNIVLFERCVCDMEQKGSRTAHNIDSTFKSGEYYTIQIMKV